MGCENSFEIWGAGGAILPGQNFGEAVSSPGKWSDQRQFCRQQERQQTHLVQVWPSGQRWQWPGTSVVWTVEWGQEESQQSEPQRGRS